MPSLSEIKASNAQAATHLPAGLVGVFPGATSGIGAAAMLEFAKRTVKPRIYFIGRRQARADALLTQMRELNPEGEYVFYQRDLSLMKTVDEACVEIAQKEKAINVLFLSAGSVKLGVDTADGLDYCFALSLYCRVRMVLNLLPLLSRATHLRRVIDVGAAGFEGQVYPEEWVARNLAFFKMRPHAASLFTMAFMGLADRHAEMLKEAGVEGKGSNVTFAHTFPGFIVTDLVRGDEFFGAGIIDKLQKVGQKFGLGMKHEDCGARMMYVALSARYPAPNGDDGKGVPAGEGLRPVKGCEGEEGSGVYSTDVNAETTGEKVAEWMRRYRADGTLEKYWTHVVDELKRITGSESIDVSAL